MATFSKDLSVTSSGVYTLEMNLVPTGSTATPVNDIQTWLHCANIWNKNYTTLAQVLADTSTLNSLIQSNNAADYMARSTDWAANPGLVPKMTSNSTPSGEAFGSTQQDDYYHAFDQLTGASGGNYGWLPLASDTSPYVAYGFPSAVKVNGNAYVGLCSYAFTSTSIKGYIEASNSKTGTWTAISSEYTFSGLTTSASAYMTYYNVPISTNSTYRYYRLRFTSASCITGAKFVAVRNLQFYKYAKCVTEDQTAMTYIGANNYCANKLLADSTWCAAICNSTYFEKVLTTKVPTMTSNTTPSGEAFATSVYSDGYAAWHAFDNITSEYWASKSPNVVNCGLGYKFTSAVSVHRIAITDRGGNTSNVKNFKLQYLNSSNQWVDANNGAFVNSQTSGTKIFAPATSVTKSTQWRIWITSNYGATGETDVSGLQFYGRT